MAICAAVDDQFFVRQSVQTIDECSGYVLVSPSEFRAATDAFTPTPEGVATAFMWGFGAVVVIGYFSSYAIGIAKNVIRRL